MRQFLNGFWSSFYKFLESMLSRFAGSQIFDQSRFDALDDRSSKDARWARSGYRLTPRRPICRARQLTMFTFSHGCVLDVISKR